MIFIVVKIRSDIQMFQDVRNPNQYIQTDPDSQEQSGGCTDFIPGNLEYKNQRKDKADCGNTIKDYNPGFHGLVPVCILCTVVS